MMRTWGAQVVASPSEDTQAGRTALAQDPTPQEPGMAISEVLEDAAQRVDTKYSLSVCSIMS